MTVRVALVDGSVTRELRRAVLRPSWPIGSVMSGDADPDALHLAAYEADVVVGCCLVLPAGYPDAALPDDWQLRGMATASELRGRGIGAAVLAAAVAEVRRHGAQRLWCNARTVALSFYHRAAFEVDGAEFIQPETGIPHYRLQLRL